MFAQLVFNPEMLQTKALFGSYDCHQSKQLSHSCGCMDDRSFGMSVLCSRSETRSDRAILHIHDRDILVSICCTLGLEQQQPTASNLAQELSEAGDIFSASWSQLSRLGDSTNNKSRGETLVTCLTEPPRSYSARSSSLRAPLHRIKPLAALFSTYLHCSLVTLPAH